jgi:ABC-2 type transport system ATP-binding protein
VTVADTGANHRAARVIQVRDLTKPYGKLRVLRGVDFDVARGSIFALLGSNGAGKTTVVNILSTLLRADSGTAGVNGFDVARQPADVRRPISLTGQFAAVDDILARPAGVHRGLERRPAPVRGRYDGAADHAVPGRGRTARRP